MDLAIMQGRPATEENRLKKEIRCYDFLDSLGISYERADHDALNTIAECEAVDKALNTKICKNLFLCNRQETSFYLVLMPGDKRFITKDLSAALGVARLSFAKETFMEEFLDITPGSVSVLGLMNDKEKQVRLIIDADVLKEEYFACHPCINTSSLKFKTSELMEKVIPAMEHEPTIVNL